MEESKEGILFGHDQNGRPIWIWQTTVDRIRSRHWKEFEAVGLGRESIAELALKAACRGVLAVSPRKYDEKTGVSDVLFAHRGKLYRAIIVVAPSGFITTMFGIEEEKHYA